MADPLSLAASLIAVSSLALSVSKTALKIRDSSNEILALRNEVEDLKLVLTQYEGLLREEWLGNQKSYIQEAERLLEEDIKVHLLALRNVLHQHLDKAPMPGRRAIAWVLLKSKVEKNRKELQNGRRRLAEIFVLIGVSNTNRILFQLASVVEDTEAARKQTEDLRQEIIRQEQFAKLAIPGGRIQSNAASHEVLLGELNTTSPGLATQASRFDAANTKLPAGPDFKDVTAAQREQDPHSVSLSEHFLMEKLDQTQRADGDLIRFSFLGTQSFCLQRCNCFCHRSRGDFRTPDFLTQVTGRLLVGFAIRSLFKTRCDDRACQPRNSNIVRLQYIFPSWFVARSLFLTLQTPDRSAPQLLLRLPRSRPHTDLIFSTISMGDLSKVQLLMSTGQASIDDVESKGGHSLLHRAFAAKHWHIAEFLLREGAPVDALDHKQNSVSDIFWTIVLSAGLSEDTYVRLKSYFKDDRYIEEAIFNQIHHAVFQPANTDLRNTIQRYPHLLNACDAYGRTPLAWASARGDYESVRILLECNANPDIAEKGGWTPLHNAMLTDRDDVSRRLLEAGADPNLESRIWKDTPLHICCRPPGFLCHIPVLLKFGAIASPSSHPTASPMVSIASRDDVEGVGLLGTAVTASDYLCAVKTAIQFRSPLALAKLLERNFNYEVIECTGKSVLHYVAMFASTEEMRIIEKCNVHLNCNIVDASGRTAYTDAKEAVLTGTRDRAWANAWNELIASCCALPQQNTISEFNNILECHDSAPEDVKFYDAQECLTDSAINHKL